MEVSFLFSRANDSALWTDQQIVGSFWRRTYPIWILPGPWRPRALLRPLAVLYSASFTALCSSQASRHFGFVCRSVRKRQELWHNCVTLQQHFTFIAVDCCCIFVVLLFFKFYNTNLKCFKKWVISVKCSHRCLSEYFYSWSMVFSYFLIEKRKECGQTHRRLSLVKSGQSRAPCRQA